MTYIVGKYGERDSFDKATGITEQARGFPVFQVWADAPSITHDVAWFVQEDDAIEYCAFKNSPPLEAEGPTT